ncbi:FtsX-like permease family protein [Leucobacter massiliensis]|uniref:ABC3 transporter permease C-terminal domain-containing protein n=1 Tax=Leucobacter massiliensis TaxID=1686285 RepID=A0A2S9QQ38_9MICO|nr:FtsX-like permease family protein [Leucobacter massiliensis]PRI11711.1 hypothetical protein B4915_04505 [Leucobacter massiliensis]
MIRRLLAGDLRRGLGASLVLLGLFFATTLLAAGGAGTAARLLGAVDGFFAAAHAPDVVQMTSGDVDTARIAEFAESRPEVADWMVSRAVVATGEKLWFGDATAPDSASVVDHYFVTQSPDFDLLLDLDNAAVRVEPGQIGVPVSDMLRHGLRIGDPVRVHTWAGELSLLVSSFVRDAQMNPALVSSKRFVVAPEDLRRLEGLIPSAEHLIEFRLQPEASTTEFMDAYRAAGLPQSGPAVDAALLRTMAFLGEGLVAVVLLLVSLLLLVIGIICLRFAVASAVHAASRELGVLRAIGAPPGFISRAFAAKYLLLAGAGAVLGCSAALLLVPVLTEQALLYTGPPAGPGATLLTVSLASAAMFGIVAVSCLISVRAAGRVPPSEALRHGAMGRSAGRWRRWSLARSRVPVTWYLGVRELQLRPRAYLVPLGVFTVAAFLLVVPVNFLTTVSSPGFVQYLGVGASQARLDAPLGSGDPGLPERVIARVGADPRIASAALLTTSRCAIRPASGEAETSLVTTGRHDLFPVSYLEGRAPSARGEVALSVLNAAEFEAAVGDTLRVQEGAGWRDAAVVGVYQDVTSGGRTAKTAGTLSCGDAIWVTIPFDAAGTREDPAVLDGIISDYADAFAGLRGYSMREYVSQTLGPSIGSLDVAVRASLAVSTVVVALIAAMFTGILLARDAAANAALRALGAPVRLVRRQYLVRLIALLLAGVALGTLLAASLGEALVSGLMSVLGAPSIALRPDPLIAYLALPALLVAAVSVATLIVARFATAARPRPTEF